MTILHTPSGVRFGLLGDKAAEAAPTLFILATSIEGTFDPERRGYHELGRSLMEHGFICVTADVPCHGEDVRPGEPVENNGALKCWRIRMEAGEAVVRIFTDNLSDILDYLVDQGYSDPSRVAVCGTSRGGFMAMHFAAADGRVRCVAGFAPVTDLLALREFAGAASDESITSLALINHADRLAGKAVWITIGNNDTRVDTDRAIAFARRVAQEAVAREKPPLVELHVTATSGHGVPPTAHAEAAEFVRTHL